MNDSLPLAINRRHFLNRFGLGVGGMALAEMLATDRTSVV